MNKLEKRESIVEAARKRFRQFGIRKTTMQEIAEDAGVAVGTLYLYFKSKEDVIIACAERFGNRHKRFAELVLKSSASAEEKLRRYVWNRYRAVEETRTGSKYTVDIARAVIRLKPERFEEDDRWLHQNIAAMLREGVQSREFRIADIERDTRVFVQALFYFLPVAGMEPYRKPTEEDLREVLDWFIATWKRQL